MSLSLITRSAGTHRVTASCVIRDARSAAEAVATVAVPLAGFERGRRTFTREHPTLHRP